MRLAVIGRDRHVDQLVRTAQDSADIDVVVFFPDSQGDHLPGVVAQDGWEALEAENDIDGILIAAPTAEFLDRRAEQLRVLIHSDIPILAVHPACEAIVAFEIEMQAEPEKIRLLTYQPWRDHAVWASVAEAIQEPGFLGRVDQVLFERRLPNNDRHTASIALAQDACIVRNLVGPIRQVSSVVETKEGTIGPVQMVSGQINSDDSSPQPPSIRWSPLHLPPLCDLRVQLIGERGNATLEWNEGDSPKWTQDGKTLSVEDSVEDSNAAELVLEKLRNVRPGLTDWVEAARGTEVAEAAARSRKRGRAVELYEESHSEQDTFKGVMAATGCLLLLLILLGFIIGAVVEGVRFPYARQAHQERLDAAEKLGEPLQQQRSPLWIRLIPAYPVLIFLLLQTLWFVAKRGPPNETTRGTTLPPEPPTTATDDVSKPSVN